MNERYLNIPDQDLSLPPNCPSSEVIAVIYLIEPGDTIKEAQIQAIKCRNVQCSLTDCQYKNIVSFKNKLKF